MASCADAALKARGLLTSNRTVFLFLQKLFDDEIHDCLLIVNVLSTVRLLAERHVTQSFD